MSKPSESVRHPVGRRRSIVWLGIGVLAGSLATGAFRPSPPPFPASLFAQSPGDPGEAPGEFQYFTFRRNLWVVHRPTGRIQFLMFPDGAEQPLIRSRIHQVDQSVFPPDQVQYQLSERNLTNFLWILNPVTGKARYIRAGRDGGFDTSAIESVARSGE